MAHSSTCAICLEARSEQVVRVWSCFHAVDVLVVLLLHTLTHSHAYTAMMSSAPGNYSASGLATALHSLPHYDIAFQTVTNTFTPTDITYLQALVGA